MGTKNKGVKKGLNPKKKKLLLFVGALALAAVVIFGIKTYAYDGGCSYPAEYDVIGCPTLKSGYRGLYVRMAQQALNQICKNPDLTADGIFGQKTKNRVISFQKATGLTADGIIGPRTWAKIDYWLGKGSNSLSCPF